MSTHTCSSLAVPAVSATVGELRRAHFTRARVSDRTVSTQQVRACLPFPRENAPRTLRAVPRARFTGNDPGIAIIPISVRRLRFFVESGEWKPSFVVTRRPPITPPVAGFKTMAKYFGDIGKAVKGARTRRPLDPRPGVPSPTTTNSRRPMMARSHLRKYLSGRAPALTFPTPPVSERNPTQTCSPAV